MSLAERLAQARINPETSQEDNPEAEKWKVSPDEMPVIPEPVGAEADTTTHIGGETPLIVTESKPSSPIFEQLSAEYSGNAVETDPSANSFDRSASRIGNILRGSGDLADSASEKLTDVKELAKTKLRGFGRSALRVVRATHEISAGIKVVATEKALDVADRVDAAAARGVEAVANKTQDAYYNTLDKAEDVLNNTLDAVGGAIEKKVTNIKEALIARKEAAKTRRQARRERWSQRWTSTKESVKSGYDRSGDALMSGFAKLENGADYIGEKMVSAKDKVNDKAERARTSAAATRAIGRAAIDARRMSA